MTELPAFRYDPADMPALREKIAELPDADTLEDFELQRTAIGPDALLALPEILEALAGPPGPAIVVQDATPMRRGEEELKPFVARLLGDAGWEPQVVVLEASEDGKVHADDERVEQVLATLRPGVPVVALGSGTVTDVAKHASFRFGEEHDPLPLVFCATANSMLAYTARMAVISKAGVKRTSPSRLSDALIHDTEVLRDAPPETMLAGIGDIAPMYVSFGDWYLGHRFGLGDFKQASVDFIADVREQLLPHAREMGERTPAGVDLLSRMLTLSGLTATLAGETAPLSGYEHVIGHMLDMSAAHFERPIGSHGSQVGMAVPLCSITLNLLLDELDPDAVELDRCYPSPAAMEAHVRETFDAIDPTGAMAEECWSDYAAKLESWHGARDAFAAFLADWDAERARLRELVPPAEDCLAAIVQAGLPTRFEDLPVPIPEAQARWAFSHAHLMRKRFSHADLLHFLGWFDEALTDRVFARLGELAAAARDRAPA